MPNIDAVTYFLDEVWPLVRAVMPDVEFRVIGADLPESLSTRSDPGVKFIGYVEDLEEYFAGIRLTVAPLRYGAGAKGKIVSSLAYGVPCVASSIASEGMGLKDGVDVLVGDAGWSVPITALEDQDDGWVDQDRAVVAYGGGERAENRREGKSGNQAVFELAKLRPNSS